MICKGFLIPKYRAEKQTQNNPFYLSEENDSVNTSDEFTSITVYSEIESICMDCKKSNCGAIYEENNQR
jgi:hypothetical protein